MYGIEINALSKSYPGIQALDKVSVAVPQGGLFGLIGPDGAGKTSLIRILATLLLQDGGAARIEGFDTQKDYARIRKIIGYMPGKFSLYEDLSVEENLHFFARLFGTRVKDNFDVIRDIYLQIEPFKKRRAGKLSGGMKQKLALCCALIHRPRVLLLDEPTTGVDPLSRKEFWNILDRLKTQGITMLAATPYMDEAARCDRVGLIHKGHILQCAAPADIISAWNRPLLAIHSTTPQRLLQYLRQQPWAHSVYSFGYALHLALRYPLQPEAVVQRLSADGFHDLSAIEIQPSIEDCFIEYIRASTFPAPA
ncbi:MAG: ABC transporter ATP-binding protein [Saprospiraceae bacterium]|jgi:ABC-2 type transport system ATP-binding protein